jgi:hypothetical protein
MNFLIIVFSIILAVLLAACLLIHRYSFCKKDIKKINFTEYSDVYYFSNEDPPSNKKMKMKIKTKL